MNLIYKEIDKNLKKNKAALCKFAWNKGYTFYSEYVCKMLEKKSAEAIRDEIIEYGIKDPPSVNTIHGVSYRVKAKIYVEPDETTEGKKTCYMCGIRDVADGNHALCTICNKAVKWKADNTCETFHTNNNCAY